ncbi:MAG: hypothetical protein KF773_30660 [Deltaproteobacteria bacterium]|nr:hypothetical protein [Deltaproteobacteria bacterium]MCW5802656.1 hypothetical protein [Deltaproteobacteria bacterium]
MATYLIDCGPSSELVELGRRVVSYLGPEATLGRSHDLVYGGVDARPTSSDVFIGLTATGTPSPEAWVHPRSGARSRELAGSIHAELHRYGGGGALRTGDLSVLAPERHPPSAAACVVEVGDRMRHARDPRSLDDLAQAIANAARGARYGKRAAARALEGDTAIPPIMQPFADLLARARQDAAFRDRALTDPIAVLHELGVDVPHDLREAMTTHLRAALAPPVAAAQGWSRGLEAPSAEVHARPWGVVVELNSQATSDLANGANAVAGVLAIVTAACGGSGAIPCAVIAGVLSGYLWAMASVISLMNRGNGVVLTIPWIGLLPGALPVVIPTPR